MADSYRLTALKRLTALLEGTSITPIEGVELPSTLAGLVFRGRGVFGDDSPKTMLSILEAPRSGGQVFAGNNEGRRDFWSLLIQGWCPDDTIHPTDNIYSLLDDVENRLDRIVRLNTSSGDPKYPEHYMLGAGLTNDSKYLIADFEMSAPSVRPPTPNISSKCWFYLPVQMELVRIAT